MSEYVLLQKCTDMIAYGYVALRNFPKSERHVLSAEIRHSMLQLQRLIIVCGKKYHRKTTLNELDTELEVLRCQLRLAQTLKYLPFRQYELWSRHLHEIGCIIGSWKKKERQTN